MSEVCAPRCPISSTAGFRLVLAGLCDSRTACTCHRHGSVLAGSAGESTDRQPQETRQTTNLAAAQTKEVREATLGSSKSRHQPGGCRPSCGGQPRVQVLMDQILRSDGHLSGGYLEWPQNVGRRRPVSVMHVPTGSPAALTPKATTHPPGHQHRGVLADLLIRQWPDHRLAQTARPPDTPPRTRPAAPQGRRRVL